MPRYAMVIVTEADFAGIAWEGIASRLGALPHEKHCPGCTGTNIVEQTASDDRAPWGCLDCDHQFEEPTVHGWTVYVGNPCRAPGEGDDEVEYATAQIELLADGALHVLAPPPPGEEN